MPRGILFLLVSILLSLTSFAQTGRELIVLSGGPALRFFEKGKEHSHDKYYFNFIDASALKIDELKKNARPGDQISWLVYRPAYQIRGFEMNADLLKLILDKANARGVALFWFDTKQELINYLNFGKDRKQEPIGSFDYFGHSNRACFMFDYSNEYDAQSREFLHDRDLKSIHPDIFSADCTAKSWGCHSGEYYSVRWQKLFGVPMEGAIGKTDYSHPGEMPFLSSPDGHWYKGSE